MNLILGAIFLRAFKPSCFLCLGKPRILAPNEGAHVQSGDATGPTRHKEMDELCAPYIGYIQLE